MSNPTVTRIDRFKYVITGFHIGEGLHMPDNDNPDTAGRERRAAARDDEAASIAEVVRSRVWPKVKNWPSAGCSPETFLFWTVAELVKAGYTITPPKKADMTVRELTGTITPPKKASAATGVVRINTAAIPVGEQWIIEGRVIARLYTSSGTDDAIGAAAESAAASGEQTS